MSKISDRFNKKQQAGTMIGAALSVSPMVKQRMKTMGNTLQDIMNEVLFTHLTKLSDWDEDKNINIEIGERDVFNIFYKASEKSFSLCDFSELTDKGKELVRSAIGRDFQ